MDLPLDFLITNLEGLNTKLILGFVMLQVYDNDTIA